MDNDLVGLLLLVGVALAFLVPSLWRYYHRRMRDRGWAKRNGWMDDTAAAAQSVEVRREVLDPSEPGYPDAEMAELSRKISAELATEAPQQRTTIRWALRGTIRGFGVLLVGSRQQIGENSGRAKAFLYHAHAFVELDAPRTLLAIYHSDGLGPAGPHEFRTGDPEFDAKFRTIAEDQAFANRILTGRVRKLLQENPAVPRMLKFDGAVLVGSELDRRSVEQTAAMGELLVTILTG